MAAVLYVLALSGAYMAGSLLLRTRSGFPPARASTVPATLTAFAVIAAAAVIQAAHPPTLMALRRDGAAVANGEPWRLATALVVQDGGLAGTLFNLGALLLIGATAERVWGTWRWVVLFAAGAAAGNIVALAWQPIGAGNSVATFGLAGAVGVRSLSIRAGGAASAAAVVSIVAGGMLVAMHDIHGAALCAGAVAALIFAV